jgi:hypothetical protein
MEAGSRSSLYAIRHGPDGLSEPYMKTLFHRHLPQPWPEKDETEAEAVATFRTTMLKRVV